jgi:transposase
VTGNQIMRAGCWAHLKRKFIDAEKASPEISREAGECVCAHHAIERQSKDVTAEGTPKDTPATVCSTAGRVARAGLVWKEQLLPRHPMADAINYALGQWSEPNVFCFDGAVPIDNNVSEREMNRVVLNRASSELLYRRKNRTPKQERGSKQTTILNA